MRPATLLRFTFAFALMLAGTGWMSSAHAQSLSAGVALDAPVYPDTRGGEDIVITQSEADFITIGGVSCANQDGGYTTDNNYFRAFDLAEFTEDTDDIMVTSVDLGIGGIVLNGNAPVTTTLRFHSVSALNPDGSFLISNATLIGEQEYVVSETEANSLQNIPITADITLEQDAIFAFEWFVPSGNPADTGNPNPFDIRYGSNAAGETGPTLLAAEPCGITDPTYVGDLGDFASLQWVLFINGIEAGGGGGPELSLTPTEINATVITDDMTTVSLTISNTGDEDLTFAFSDLRGVDLVESVMPESGTVSADGSQSVSVVLTADGLSPDTYTDFITLTTNDADEGTVNIPITLEVTDTPAISFNPNPLVEMLETDMTGTEVVAVRNNTDGPVTVTFPQFAEDRRAVTPQFPSLDLAKGEADPRQGTAQLRGAGGPDNFGYTWIDSNEPGGPPANAFVDISDTGTAVTWTLSDSEPGFPPEDEGYADVALPFTFSFYGQDYNGIRLFTNGFATFDQTYGDPDFNSFGNDPIPDPPTPNATLYPFWDDLTLEDPTADTYVLEEPGRVIIQYEAGRFQAAAPTYFFQIVLNANGSIEYRYGSMSNTLDSATIGIENEDGTDGLQIAFNETYIESGLTILISAAPSFITGVTPASGTIPAGIGGPVTVSFDATGLLAGTYEANLILEADIDGEVSTFELPVVLMVGGESACVIAPDPLDFGDVTVGESATDAVTVSNGGTAACSLTDASFDDSAFSTDFSGPVDVAPGGSADINVTFTPDVAGAASATLTVGVADDDDLTSTVQGNGGSPADFSVDPDELDFTVIAGNVSDAQTITLSNNGSGEGTYSVSAVIVTNRPDGEVPTRAEGPVERQSEIVLDPEVLPQTTEPSRGGDIVGDGSFETGTPNAAWSEFSSNFGTPICDEASCGLGGGSGPFDGVFWTWFGGIGGAEEIGSVEQDVTIPAGAATLSFWHEIPAVGTTGFMSVTMDGDEIFRSTDADAIKYGVYTQVMVDVSAYADGGTHTLRFESTTDAGDGATNFFVDLVEITSEAGLVITVDPESGTVDAGGSADISVVADASTAEVGSYSAEVIFTTNDPDNETFTVPVSIEVVGTPNTEDEGIPTEFALQQNYPNPFADLTTIKYALPEAARVTVTVYDAVGRRVATLVDEDRTAGYHEAQWVTRGLASGVYFYTIEAGTFSRTMKMSLVR